MSEYDDIVRILADDGLDARAIHERLNNTHRECTLKEVQDALSPKTKKETKAKPRTSRK
jgi:hypothetical protein